MTERYRDYDILWEIINEPNENNDMSVVSNYVRVCEVLYPVIKAANPSAKVSVGSIAMQSDAWLEQAIKEGLWKHGDVIAVHPYTFMPPLPPEQVAVWYGQIREVMYRKHVPDAARKPLAVTEWGYSTAGYHSSLTPQVQAEYLVRAYLVSLLNGVTVVNLYELCDNPTPPANSAVESSFGIFTKDFADKPAAVALRTMVADAPWLSPRISPGHGQSRRLCGRLRQRWETHPGRLDLGGSAPVETGRLFRQGHGHGPARIASRNSGNGRPHYFGPDWRRPVRRGVSEENPI